MQNSLSCRTVIVCAMLGMCMGLYWQPAWAQGSPTAVVGVSSVVVVLAGGGAKCFAHLTVLV
jgi:hypothetical protein